MTSCLVGATSFLLHPLKSHTGINLRDARSHCVSASSWQCGATLSIRPLNASCISSSVNNSSSSDCFCVHFDDLVHCEASVLLFCLCCAPSDDRLPYGLIVVALPCCRASTQWTLGSPRTTQETSNPSNRFHCGGNLSNVSSLVCSSLKLNINREGPNTLGVSQFLGAAPRLGAHVRAVFFIALDLSTALPMFIRARFFPPALNLPHSAVRLFLVVTSTFPARNCFFPSVHPIPHC